MTQAGKETIYKEDFEAVLEQTNDTNLKELRQKAFDYFTETGFPTPKNEEWKYTNIASLVNSKFKIQNSKLEAENLDLFEKFNFERNGFTALNLAFADVQLITIPKETSVAEPFEFNFKADENSANFPHIIVIAEAGSKATIIENYESDGKSFTNSAIQIFVEDNANLTHYRIQKESNEAFHIGTTEVSVGRGSLYNSTNINLGGQISRHDVHLKFMAEGGEVFVDGMYMLAENQHHDTHSTIDHALPNCVSHQTYKGVLNDKSRGVFNGKVFVRENASGTDAQQSNKNLLLSNDARVDTKPQLEIFNDDVKCSHGATVGQLEDEELFYLLSRGISENLAKNLLTYGFAEEIINKIEIEAIKNELDAMVLNRLDVNLEV
ncbi:MAG: Fe-S cluster assembly protein SufD [Pyrinomonadaceae bacterium]|jgi:Fe-S cluster assembly protein SufD|nr:Fe-S cluster assembly protein SufD [Pyrinomonadaceae bacterium]